jgi:hypothetical protein
VGGAAGEAGGFAGLVRGALDRLYDPVALWTHPLARSPSPDGAEGNGPVRAGEAPGAGCSRPWPGCGPRKGRRERGPGR